MSLEILQLCISRADPFKHPNHLQMIQVLGWADSEIWIWVWLMAELISLLALPSLHSRVSSPAGLWLGQPMLPSAGGRGSSHVLVGAWLTPTHAFRASSTVLPSQCVEPTLSSAEACEEIGQLSRSHTLGAGSPGPSPSGPALPYCPNEVQDLLSQMLQW